MVVSSVTPLMPGGDLGPAVGLVLGRLRRRSSRTTFHSSVSSSAGVGDGAGRLVLGALVHEQRGVAAVVEDHVGAAAVGPAQRLLGAPPVLLERLALPGVDRHARGRRRCRGPTTTAAAAWSWVEKMLQLTQRTSAPRATSVSMSTAVWMVMCSEPVMRAPASGWLVGVLGAEGHEAGHLVLGELDLLAAERREGEVGDLEVARAWVMVLSWCGVRVVSRLGPAGPTIRAARGVDATAPGLAAPLLRQAVLQVVEDRDRAGVDARRRRPGAATRSRRRG